MLSPLNHKAIRELMHKWEFKKRKVDVLARESQATSEQDDSQMEIHAAAEENPHSKIVCFL